MTNWCPSCQRYFDEPGYCPFDGTQLSSAAGDGAETLPSMAMPAAQLPTEIPTERPTEVPTNAPVVQKFRAVSASESTGAAIAAIQGRLSEYDRLVGQTLDGRYHIERKIGEGGMGVVFSARHAVIERPLAIKVLKREVMRDTATIKRFVQEAKAASRIGHPNIVDVTDFGTTTDGLTYQVMEFVDGITLGQALRQGGPFPAARATRIAAQLARALGAAHAKGIVHRDLKPENIFLLDRDGRKDFVKIVDFGIAKVIPVDGIPVEGPRLTRAGAVFGTPEYMAPEQAAGRGDTDGRVDIYALGIILYEMLTGRVPHRGDTMIRTLAMQMLDPIEPPSKVRPDLTFRPELEAVLMKALAKKREQRYAKMAELGTELERAIGAPVGDPAPASVTDARTYALPAVPPGADQAPAIPAPVRGETSNESRAEPSAAGAAPTDGRGTGGERRYRDEPAFVHTQNTPGMFDNVVDLPPPRPYRPARWPIALGAAVVIAAGGVALALYLRDRDQRGTEIAATPDDAAVAVIPPLTPRDAPTAVVEVVADAATAVVVDAGAVAAKRDARVRPHGDARGIPPGVRLTANGMVAVRIVTSPEGGRILEGGTFRGTSRPLIEAPYGSRARFRCMLPGYEEGHVDVVFNGEVELVMCVMTRIVRCVDGLKNPIDDCPDARP